MLSVDNKNKIILGDPAIQASRRPEGMFLANNMPQMPDHSFPEEDGKINPSGYMVVSCHRESANPDRLFRTRHTSLAFDGPPIRYIKPCAAARCLVHHQLFQLILSAIALCTCVLCILGLIGFAGAYEFPTLERNTNLCIFSGFEMRVGLGQCRLIGLLHPLLGPSQTAWVASVCPFVGLVGILTLSLFGLMCFCIGSLLSFCCCVF